MNKNEEEHFIESFAKMIIESKESNDSNPNGVIHKWDEIITSGGKKAVITHMNKYNGIWFAIIIFGDSIGRVEVIMPRDKRNWKRTGRNFKMIESLFDILGKNKC